MNIVTTVAAGAGARQRDLGGRLDRVTCMTGESLVCSFKRISSLRIVIEAPARPAVRVVAARTVIGQTALVARVFVATRAGARRVFE